MKIISWNIRGLGDRTKRRSIKELISKEKPDVVILQEVKRESICALMISAIWGVRYKDWAFLPSIGKSEGILIIWDVRVMKALNCISGNFLLSLRMETSAGESWWLTGVYGPCKYMDRNDFWEELAALYGLCGDKWCIAGDFNTVRFSSEKVGVGISKITYSMKEFDKLINDMGLRGPEAILNFHGLTGEQDQGSVVFYLLRDGKIW